MFKKQNFTRKATAIWTGSDFPAYGILFGWMTATRLSCPYWMNQTKSFRLKHGKKWFDYHCQFLPHEHVFRKNRSAFCKNIVKHSEHPPRMNGHQVWDHVSKISKTTDHSGKSNMHRISHN